MNTPSKKYQNDVEYRQLVDTLESFIAKAQYTPSEMREAVILACINHEMRNPRPVMIDRRAWEALRVLEEFSEDNE